MAHDVFISYSTKDAAVADAVCAGLEARGIRCWIAPRNIISGTKYSQAIINAITQSPLMVMIYSSNANESNHVLAEIDRAYNKRIPIIPFRIADVPLSADLEYYLSTSQWLDALEGPRKEHLERLVETVRLLLKKTGSLPKPPSPPIVVQRSSKVPWIIAGSAIAVAGLFLVILAIGGIFIFTRNSNSNRPQSNASPAVVTNPVPTPTARSNLNQSLATTAETELMIRARKAILDAELSGDKVALGRLLSQDFRTRRPDDQILNKAQLLGEMDRGLFEGLKVPDRSKVTVVVDDPRPLRNIGLMSRVKISYSDGGRMITEVRKDLTLFSKEGNQLVATVNRWTRE